MVTQQHSTDNENFSHFEHYELCLSNDNWNTKKGSSFTKNIIANEEGSVYLSLNGITPLIRDSFWMIQIRRFYFSNWRTSLCANYYFIYQKKNPEIRSVIIKLDFDFWIRRHVNHSSCSCTMPNTQCSSGSRPRGFNIYYKSVSFRRNSDFFEIRKRKPESNENARIFKFFRHEHGFLILETFPFVKPKSAACTAAWNPSISVKALYKHLRLSLRLSNAQCSR